MGRKATTRQTPVDQHLDWHLDPGPRTTTHSPAPTPTPILTSTPSSTQSTFSRWLMGPICERQKKWICHQLGDLKISFDWLQFGDLRLNVTCYIYIYIHIFVKGGPVSVDDGFSPMLWTISCKWYSTHGIRKDLGVELGHCKVNQKLKIVVVCDADFYSVHVARVPSRNDFGASTNQVGSGSWMSFDRVPS